jgi:uncharacterized protein
MSAPTNSVGRADLALDEASTLDFLRRGWSGQLGTVGGDGWPYVVPLLYVVADNKIYMHHARRDGHLARNLQANPRGCFAVEEPGDVYAYGRFQCDSSVSYTSAIAFGNVSFVDDPSAKAEFCDALMAKYGGALAARPEGYYPRLDAIAVFALRIERITGKRIPLPVEAQRWPALDRTRSPHGQPPD